MKSSGKEKMLGNILDSNREVAPQYIAFDIETKDGESSIGIISNEATSTMTVLQAFGKKDVIQRSTLQSMRSLRVADAREPRAGVRARTISPTCSNTFPPPKRSKGARASPA